MHMEHLIKDCLDDLTQILYIFLNTKYQETVQAFLSQTENVASKDTIYPSHILLKWENKPVHLSEWNSTSWHFTVFVLP